MSHSDGTIKSSELIPDSTISAFAGAGSAPEQEPLLFSVVIATYNRAKSLCRAVESVLAQPGDYFEVIIGNDASPDNTHDAVQPYLADPRVRYYRNEANLGMLDNYLKIFGEARGSYLFVLTDDDWMVDGGLEQVAQVVRRNPGIGYLVSDLITVDDRSGTVFGIDRAYSADRQIEPSLQGMAEMVGFAWVLSRQVIRRDVIDWPAWRLYKHNIFFPIIYSGRAMLRAPSYYLARHIVTHTGFNEVFWHKFGKNELDIGFNLSADFHRTMRAILHDYEMTPEVRTIINRWEFTTLKQYLYSEQTGFYDLIRVYGWRAGMEKLNSGFTVTGRGYLAIAAFFIELPLRRAWVTAKSLARRYAPRQFQWLKRIKNRYDGSAKARLS